MRARHCLPVCVLVSVLACPVRAEDEKPLDSAAMAGMMAQAMELAGPGPEHARLAGLAGAWDMELRMWMSPEAEQPLVSTGKATNRMILGGRFLLTESVGGEDPMRIETFSLMGFDRRSGEYTSVGLDNTGTYYVAARGGFDDARGAIVMRGEDYDAVLNHTQIWDQVVTIVSDDEYRVEVIFLDEAHTHGMGPFKMVEVTCRRVGSE